VGGGFQVVASVNAEKWPIFVGTKNDDIMKYLPGLLLIFLMTCFTGSYAQHVRVINNISESCRSGDRCVVEIVIEKSGIEGFARIQQILPEGVTAELVQDGGSDFIFDKQRVSFIWLSLPAGDQVKVSYRLVFQASVKGKFAIGEGTFSYLQENKLQKLAIASQPVWLNMKPEITSPAPVVAPPVVKEEPKVVTQQPVQQQPVQQQPVTEKQPVTEAKPVQEEPKAIELKPLKEQTPEPPVTVTEIPPVREEPKKAEPLVVKEEPKPKPQEPKPVQKEPVVQPAAVSTPSATGTTFRVQFAALKTQRDVESLRKQFNITEQVFQETSDGWNRYTFGPFATQAEAESARKAYMTKNGGNPMVVKYQDGKRVQ
jgi:cell division protein FtsN